MHTHRHLNLCVLNPIHTSTHTFKSQLPKSLHSKPVNFTNLFLKQVIPSSHLLHPTNYKRKWVCGQMSHSPFQIKKTAERLLKEVVIISTQYSLIPWGKPQFIALPVEGLFFSLKLGQESVIPCFTRNYLMQKYMSISHHIQDKLKKT